MKKIIPASVLALAVATGFLFNHQPAQAGDNHDRSARGFHHNGSARGFHHGGYGRGYYHGGYARGYYHGGYRGYYYGGYAPFYDNGFFGPYPLAACYPSTQVDVRENSAYHPQAYADGYTQGQKSAADGDKYERRTAGGEFARGFKDGYYGKEFAGQKIVVPDRYIATSGCGWY